ncbi:MAG: IclR family transcriptional regulator [Gammaproteobacteria bacterium]|nr:IclR family transcriptional regulator [Gammaproteobacteria bacterium]MBU1441488.1 IclR family transcriptional regulator [Gammaproteobacteria bacterium]MBU2288549.1 IclR family transcriptional regulator [Gammaproteobacteria bacterium]MBU2408606.1 IclR family transcriptional regulator [Gammaproteobacteria bacterium]
MEKSRRGIQSIEVGSALLLQLAKQVRPLALKDLAKAAGMTAGKAHPYMVSFLKVGFVDQTEAGQYELGPLALQLGLSKLRRMDPVKEASKLIEELATETGQSVAVVVWGNLGPTVVRLEEPIQPLHVNLRTGTVMSLADTATGRLFSAYMPSKVIERLLDNELARSSYGAPQGSPYTPDRLEAELNQIRKHGLSRTKGHPIPGIDALCAPVFDPAGHIVLGLLVMGPSTTFDSEYDGAVAKPLLQCAAEISRRIGRTAD